jgi:alpha-methylacyl-CoA racemase
MAEAPFHPHGMARESFVTIAGVVQPAPAPRFGATQATPPVPPEPPGASTFEALLDWGFDRGRLETLARAGAIGAP